MKSGFVLGPGEGSAYGFHGSVAVIKASGEDTFGQLGVIESVYPAALSVHEHVHAGEDEMFYVLGGEMEVFCGQDRWTVGAGSFVFVPRDRPHGFTVSSAGPARALVITGPSRLAAQIAERGEPVPPGLACDARAPGQIGGKSLVQSAGRYSTAVPFVFHDPFSKASILMMMWSTSSLP
jgi:quercetin dioxygenase-like cupin family protein